MKLERWTIVALAATLLAQASVHAAKREGEPQQVTVQHILVAFKRSVPGKKVERTKDEARALAEELVERARAAKSDEEFTQLVEKYTDDSPPGIYLLTNEGAPTVAGGRSRRDMVARFGDVAFTLAIGEVGLAAYHGGLSPYGWHIIKRLE